MNNPPAASRGESTDRSPHPLSPGPSARCPRGRGAPGWAGHTAAPLPGPNSFSYLPIRRPEILPRPAPHVLRAQSPYRGDWACMSLKVPEDPGASSDSSPPRNRWGEVPRSPPGPTPVSHPAPPRAAAETAVRPALRAFRRGSCLRSSRTSASPRSLSQPERPHSHHTRHPAHSRQGLLTQSSGCVRSGSCHLPPSVWPSGPLSHPGPATHPHRNSL